MEELILGLPILLSFSYEGLPHGRLRTDSVQDVCQVNNLFQKVGALTRNYFIYLIIAY